MNLLNDIDVAVFGRFVDACVDARQEPAHGSHGGLPVSTARRVEAFFRRYELPCSDPIVNA